MKILLKILSCIVLFLCLGCQAAAQAGPTANPNVKTLLPVSGQGSLKGYELYSWQKDGKWVFSVLLGTNREKTLDEIQSPEARLDGLEALKAQLLLIPAGESLIWLQRDGLALPPDDVVAVIEKLCRLQGLNLSISR